MVAPAALVQWLRPEPACRWQHDALYADNAAWAILDAPRNGIVRQRDEGQTHEHRTCPHCHSSLARQIYALTVFGGDVSECLSPEAALMQLAVDSKRVLRLERSGDDFSWWLVDVETGNAIAEVTA